MPGITRMAEHVAWHKSDMIPPLGSLRCGRGGKGGECQAGSPSRGARANLGTQDSWLPEDPAFTLRPEGRAGWALRGPQTAA